MEALKIQVKKKTLLYKKETAWNGNFVATAAPYWASCHTKLNQMWKKNTKSFLPEPDWRYNNAVKEANSKKLMNNYMETYRHLTQKTNRHSKQE